MNNRYQYICLCFFLSLYGNVFACETYIASQAGNIPILLTSPHGAGPSRLLPGVPLRTGENGHKGFVTRADRNTDLLTWRIYRILSEVGLKPYIVVAGVNRSQIDFNRPAEQAYESVEAEPCYQYYHNAIINAITAIKSQWGEGFILDVHGQSKYSYDILRGTRNRKTIHQLVSRYKQDVTEEDEGFFSVLRQKNRYSIHPQKGKKERFYIGGFTLKQYGSHRKNGIDALQLEIGRDIRMDENKREKMAQDIAEAITRFYRRYY